MAEKTVIEASYPIPNVWLGVSVENQWVADKRIPVLLATPAPATCPACAPYREWLGGEGQ